MKSVCVCIALLALLSVCVQAQNPGYSILPNNTVVKIYLTVNPVAPYAQGYLFGSGDASNTIQISSTKYDLFQFVQLVTDFGQTYFVGFLDLNSTAWLGVNNYGASPLIAYAAAPNTWEYFEIYSATTVDGTAYYYIAWAGLDGEQVNYVYYNFDNSLSAPYGGVDTLRSTFNFIPV
jgi:hypothetical protein